MDHVGDEGQQTGQQPFGRLARPALFHRAHSTARSTIRTKTAAASATGKIFGRGFFQIGGIDGDGTDPISTAAAASYNAVGSPRFGAVEQSQGSAAKTKNILGSYDYVFSAPVLGLPGRGIDVNLALTCNSRVWTKETAGMTFNYGKGWPAAGWTLGYGRLIENYDNQGNWLLIQPDGTRIHLQKQTGGGLASTDGSFITVGAGTGGAVNGKLRYPDGTLVTYSNAQNGRWLPGSIRSRNGDRITIAYKQYNNTTGDPHYFPYMWAISQITDTLGRIITFNYYGDTGLSGRYNRRKAQIRAGGDHCSRSERQHPHDGANRLSNRHLAVQLQRVGGPKRQSCFGIADHSVEANLLSGNWAGIPVFGLQLIWYCQKNISLQQHGWSKQRHN
jgi:hypothetical protein